MPKFDQEDKIQTVVVNVCERLQFVIESAYKMHELGRMHDLINDAWWANLDHLIKQCGEVPDSHLDMLDVVLSYR